MTEDFLGDLMVKWPPIILKSSLINRLGLNNETSKNLLQTPKNLGLRLDISQRPIIVIKTISFIIINHILYKPIIPDHLFCLLRNLYAGQEAIVRTGHGTTDWFQIGKGVRQGCILSPCLFNFYTEYIMRNAGLEETQVGIKTAGRNINHLRYADDSTVMAESEEELKSLLRKVKEESEKVGLKLNIQKTKIIASGPITS